MAKKHMGDGDDTQRENEHDVSRRDFVRTGAAAGLGAGALLTADPAHAQAPASGAGDMVWDYEVDVVIAGGGCAGLTAAIRARDLGASVLVVDQNYDLGGRMLHSGAFVSLGGGDPVQRRDMKGESDKEGLITADPAEGVEELDDNVELLFTDVTDWSVVDPKAQSPYRYNERELARAWAENCPATRQFLIDNYVRFTRVGGTHGGGGLSRARGARCFLMLGDKTDIKAGTITAEDAGVADPERTSAFAPVQMNNASRAVAPGAVSNGVALARPLEFSAREKGVEFILHRRFADVIREQPFSGRVVGIRAHYSPRRHPETGELMQSYWQNGNVDERRETVTIRARRGVIMASGGHAGNPQVRSMFYPAMREPAFPTSGVALQGPHGQDASALDRRPAGGREPRGDAAEPVVSHHVSHLDPARHPGRVHDHDARAPDVRLPRLGGGQRRQRRLRGVHRGEPGRGSASSTRSVFPPDPAEAGTPATAAPPARGSTTSPSTGATARRSGSGRCTATTTASTPRSP